MEMLQASRGPRACADTFCIFEREHDHRVILWLGRGPITVGAGGKVGPSQHSIINLFVEARSGRAHSGIQGEPQWRSLDDLIPHEVLH